MKTFFTSDHHFGHFGIIAHCSRPFATTDEMDAAMIERWNSVVGRRDHVYHLGDFIWGKVADAFETFNMLNGRIFVMEGNHDRQWWGKTAYYSRSGLKVTPIYSQHVYKFRLSLDDIKEEKHITLSHYAMRTWYRAHAGAWHLYGHSHTRLPPLGRSFDVGVDGWDFYPVSLDEVIEKMFYKEPNPEEPFEPDD